MSRLLSTEVVPRDQRLAYWTDMICNVYVQLGCDPIADRRGDFEGSIRQHTLPSLDVSVVTSGPQKVMRTPGHICSIAALASERNAGVCETGTLTS